MAAATIALRRRLSSRGISPWPARSPAGAVLPAVCAAFAAFAEKRYAEVVALLEPVRRDFVRLGGSGARRLEDLRLELDFFGVVLVHRLHRLAVGSDQAEGHLLLACKRVERPQP
jgi:hypothetical protein